MERENAINYLQGKGKIRQSTKIIEDKIVKVKKKIKVPTIITVSKRKKVTTYVDPKFNRNEEKEIKEVMKEGRIYGDPMVVLNYKP